MLVVALIVLGPERLPEVLRTVAKVMRELRAASNTVMRELTEGFEDPLSPRVTKPAELTDNARRRIAALPGNQPSAQPHAAPTPPDGAPQP